jgi:hypothetical protein
MDISQIKAIVARYNQPGETGAIKIPFAEKEGFLRHVSQVGKGLACGCVCPVCRQSVIARKGDQKRHHFAHSPGAKCNAETVLHYLAKRLLFEKLQNLLSRQVALVLRWKCQLCGDQHSLDFFDKVKTIVTEQELGACRPDISLLDERGEPNVLIEIVVAHSPDENVLLFTSQRQIPLLIFRVRSAEDLEEMVASPTINPELIIHCSKRRCPECGGPLYRKALYVLPGKCWRCGAPLNLAFLDIDGHIYGPDLFSDRDRRIIRQEGVFLRDTIRPGDKQRIVNHICPHCGAVTGNAYLRQLKRYEKRLFVQNSGLYCRQCRKHSDEEIFG